MKTECRDLVSPTWKIKGARAYKNGVYFGDVIMQDGPTLKIKYMGDNRYMKGHISTITFIDSCQ